MLSCNAVRNSSLLSVAGSLSGGSFTSKAFSARFSSFTSFKAVTWNTSFCKSPLASPYQSGSAASSAGTRDAREDGARCCYCCCCCPVASAGRLRTTCKCFFSDDLADLTIDNKEMLAVIKRLDPKWLRKRSSAWYRIHTRNV